MGRTSSVGCRVTTFDEGTRTVRNEVEGGILRVAVVGAGGWGEPARPHLLAPSGHASSARSWSAATRRGRGARGRRYGAAPYTDLDEMLDARAARPGHRSACRTRATSSRRCSSSARGVPLLVEKPLVFDLAEADALLAEAAERDLFFAINFNHRYAEPVQRRQGGRSTPASSGGSVVRDLALRRRGRTTARTRTPT